MALPGQLLDHLLSNLRFYWKEPPRRAVQASYPADREGSPLGQSYLMEAAAAESAEFSRLVERVD